MRIITFIVLLADLAFTPFAQTAPTVSPVASEPSPMQSNDDLFLSRSTIDGGGAMRATGGAFDLSGTIGQPDAGFLSGGDFELTGGFWFELLAGDCGEDGGVSVGDAPSFVTCLTGPSRQADVACWCGDFDGDSDTDLRDFAEFQNEYVAP